MGPSISTHALREEGDELIGLAIGEAAEFLPTPSARRATLLSPPEHRPVGISTHALREEGDLFFVLAVDVSARFLPTPSARRATALPALAVIVQGISTHALREEGDRPVPRMPAELREISTHALREEGDEEFVSPSNNFFDFYPRPPRGGRRLPSWTRRPGRDFYPRPPRGGRRTKGAHMSKDCLFLPTPSARRATTTMSAKYWQKGISTHALREEGDGGRGRRVSACRYFYPRPPRGGRPDCSSPDGKHGLFLPTPSARRATVPILPRLNYKFGFLPTPSARRATLSGQVGKDFKRFLPTPSARRATVGGSTLSYHMYDFYPRPPRGGRRTREDNVPFA